MAEAKTKRTTNSVSDFIETVADEKRRQDCRVIINLMAEVTETEPVIWGTSIVGFGRYHYKYESGREGEGMILGFSPRKTDLTIYLMPGSDAFPDLMARLGKFKTGKVCLYIKKLDDVDLKVLKELLQKSVAAMADKRIDK